MRDTCEFFDSFDEVVKRLHEEEHTVLFYQEASVYQGQAKLRRVYLTSGKEVATCRIGNTGPKKWMVFPKPTVRPNAYNPDDVLEKFIQIDDEFLELIKDEPQETLWAELHRVQSEKKRLLEQFPTSELPPGRKKKPL